MTSCVFCRCDLDGRVTYTIYRQQYSTPTPPRPRVVRGAWTRSNFTSESTQGDNTLVKALHVLSLLVLSTVFSRAVAPHPRQ